MTFDIRVGYALTPSEPTNVNAKKYSFAVGLRKGYGRHIFAGNSSDIAALSQPNIAFHHFPEDVIILNARHLHGAQFIKTINAEVGKKVGMMAVDRVKDSFDYYALPNQSLVDAESYLTTKDVQRYERGLGLLTPARVSSTSQQALRDSVSSADIIIAATTASNLKLEKRREEDLNIRSSLTEIQEKYMKRIQKKHKVTCDTLKNALSKCEESDKLLSVKKKELPQYAEQVQREHRATLQFWFAERPDSE